MGYYFVFFNGCKWICRWSKSLTLNFLRSVIFTYIFVNVLCLFLIVICIIKKWKENEKKKKNAFKKLKLWKNKKQFLSLIELCNVLFCFIFFSIHLFLQIFFNERDTKQLNQTNFDGKIDVDKLNSQ